MNGTTEQLLAGFRLERLDNPALRRALVRALVVGALLVYALAFQGARGLWEPDEGRYAAVAVNMLERGDFLVPRLPPDIPHFTKPPLTYWLMAGSIALLGQHELAVRLPGALAFAATVLLVGGIARRLGERNPPLAAAVYATFLLPASAANIASTDSLLTLFEALAGYGFVASLTAQRPAVRRRWVTLMWLGFALAFLTKGPPGLLPLAAFATFVVIRDGLPAARRLVTAGGLVLFAVVGLGWFALVVARQPELLGYFVGYEVVERVVGAAHGRNPGWLGAARAYLPALLLGGLPWLPLAAMGASGLGRPWRRRFWRELRRRDTARLLLALWVGVPLAVLCLARSRMPLYVVPLFVPLAVAVARAVEGRIQPRRRAALAAAAAVTILALRLGASQVPSDKDAAGLAARISSAAGGQLDEVLLVNTRNGFGLEFYLDAEVEHVALSAGQLDRYRLETLDQELAEHRARRVYLVDRGRRDELLRRLASLGGSARAVASWGHWDIVTDAGTWMAGARG